MRFIILGTILGTAVLALSTAASAGISLSPIMQAWNHDKRSIQAMLGGRTPYDEAKLRQDLQSYITNSVAVVRNAPGGSAEARDFAARFDGMLSDCRSCHAIYNN
jgi:cytochrome c556